MVQRDRRPSLPDVYLKVARLIGSRSTCRHREQGAVLVKDNHIISTGYNGSAPGQKHCIDIGYCQKHDSGICRAEGLHGESNALLSAARLGISTEGAVLYSVFSPCRTCCNMVKVAGIVTVVFEESYDGFVDGPDYLRELGVKVWQMKIQE